jgi:transcriptional regulator with XRE-family HTH domain
MHVTRIVRRRRREPREPELVRRREVLTKLGEKMRSCRRERGLTQEALAAALHISVAYVSLIERGDRNPPYTTVVAMARALGVSVREIVPGDDLDPHEERARAATSDPEKGRNRAGRRPP